MKKTIYSFAFCLFSAVVQAAPIPLTYWDFLSGGDGVRMTQIVDEFNKGQNEIRVTKSTLTWGEPFYTKVHTAVVSGPTPDVMTYHLSRFRVGITSKDLRPITGIVRPDVRLRPFASGVQGQAADLLDA